MECRRSQQRQNSNNRIATGVRFLQHSTTGHNLPASDSTIHFLQQRDSLGHQFCRCSVSPYLFSISEWNSCVGLRVRSLSLSGIRANLLGNSAIHFGRSTVIGVNFVCASRLRIRSLSLSRIEVLVSAFVFYLLVAFGRWIPRVPCCRIGVQLPQFCLWLSFGRQFLCVLVVSTFSFSTAACAYCRSLCLSGMWLDSLLPSASTAKGKKHVRQYLKEEDRKSASIVLSPLLSFGHHFCVCL